MWKQSKVNEMAEYFLMPEEVDAFVVSVELGTFSCEDLLDSCEITDLDAREEIINLINDSSVSPRQFRKWIHKTF